MTKTSFVKVAKQYAADVLSGKQVACKWVKLACQRFVDDLKRYQTKSPYWFDEKSAERVCKFVQLLTHTKGELAGKTIQLEPWQIFILTNVYGWKTESGQRRFRRVYIEVPRGNGKSAISSAVALYALCADREPGAEVYSFATTRDQAAIVFGDAKRMAEQNQPLRDAFGLEVLAKALVVNKTNSTFQAKSAEGSTLDGLNTHHACIDELHAHKTRAVYDVVETSLGKRRNSLLWVITTAGFDLSGICYEVRSMVVNVLQGNAVDETQFGIIYSIDEGDDWTTLDALKKANPNWGISVQETMVLSLQQKARLLASARTNFLTKHLNVWCNASTAWMNMEAWDKCADPELEISDFSEDPCFIGVDLSSKKDLAARMRVFTRDIDGKKHVFAFGDYYLPEDAVAQSSSAQMKGWSELGIVKATPGAITDFDLIEEDTRKDLSTFDVRLIGYDPWQAMQFANDLSNDGAPMKEVRQTVAQMSDPMKTLEALVLSGRFHHDGNPALRWMAANVVAHLDAKDNIYPRKERYENKIDGIVALIIAISLVQIDGQNNEPDFSEFTNDPLVLDYV